MRYCLRMVGLLPLLMRVAPSYIARRVARDTEEVACWITPLTWGHLMTSRLEMRSGQREFTRTGLSGIGSMFSGQRIRAPRAALAPYERNDGALLMLQNLSEYDVGFCRGAGQYLFDPRGSPLP